MAHERGENILKIVRVNQYGQGFWPNFMAYPVIEPVQLADTIERQLQYGGERAVASAEARERLAHIAKVARVNPYKGWALLAADNTKLEKGYATQPYFRQMIFHQVVWDTQDMVIFLGDKHTQDVLRKRLGVIPPLRPTKGIPWRYRHIQAALNRNDGIAFELKL